MSRRMYLILLATGLNVFILFTMVSTPTSVLAHDVSNRSSSPIPNTSNKIHPSVASPNVNTNIVCQAAILTSGWIQTGNGPGACRDNAWEVETPTSDTAFYDLGTIGGAANYHLRAFITNSANAPMDYIITAFPTRRIADCFYNQVTGFTWEDICSFSTTNADFGADLNITEQSGAVHSFIMSSSAIQALPV